MGKLLLLTDTAYDLASTLQDAAKIEIKHFPDGEIYCRIPVSCKAADVLLFHRAFPDPNNNLIKLFLCIDAIKKQGPASIKAVIPYMPYARMDKQVKDGEAVSAETICKTVSNLGANEIITVDCHFIKDGAGVFNTFGARIRNYTASKALISSLKKKAKNPLVISPDQGASYMTAGEKDSASMKKVRGDYSEGDNAYRQIAELKVDFEVKGRDVIIIDDMVSTGSTMIKAVKKMKEAGAKRVFCAATHGLFLNDAANKLMEAGAEEIIVSDTIPNSCSKTSFAGLMGDQL